MQKQPVYHPQMVTGEENHSVGKAEGRWKAAGTKSNGNYRGNRVVARKGTMKYPHSIVSFQKPHPSVANHPTEKPVALLEYLIRTYTDPDDVVLDFCMGSGSTGVAALQTGRRFVGVELNQQHYQTAAKRIGAASQQIKME